MRIPAIWIFCNRFRLSGSMRWRFDWDGVVGVWSSRLGVNSVCGPRTVTDVNAVIATSHADGNELRQRWTELKAINAHAYGTRLHSANHVQVCCSYINLSERVFYCRILTAPMNRRNISGFSCRWLWSTHDFIVGECGGMKLTKF